MVLFTARYNFWFIHIGQKLGAKFSCDIWQWFAVLRYQRNPLQSVAFVVIRREQAFVKTVQSPCLFYFLVETLIKPDDRPNRDAIFALFEFWVIDLCFLFSVWYAHAYHAVICAMICAMICVAEHDMRIRKWHVFLNISQVLLNISLLKSFLLMIYVFKWHNLTILDM